MKKKAKLWHWLIPENVYRFPIHLVLCSDYKKAQEWTTKNVCKSENDWSSLACGRTMYFPDPGKLVVWIQSPKNIVVIAHEVVHAVFMILDMRGVPLREENSETFAYLHEYFLGEMMYLCGHGRYTHRKIDNK